uniref:AB hydrolase-1 domain-containing protein n=1 Tax=Thermosporothrix sp. COM3 TaxID=2490863 RepID=A0A455SGN6_9CHLR|nr:hypothetical protein KTC_12790 [Thermosporothrix sp. COM3]
MQSSLHLTRQPVAGRTPLLCIPGTYCSPEVFELIDERLFPEIQVLPISWMTSPGPWDIPTLGQRVQQLAEELGPCLLVGHSTGGAIALAAALSNPASFRGLLLSDTGANMHGHGDVSSILKIIEQGATGSAFFQQLMKRSFLHQPEPALLQRLLEYAENVPSEAALQALRSQAALDLSNDLSRLMLPVIVMHGRHDQARPIAHAQLLSQRLPTAELFLLDSGHTPMVEVPSEYERLLRRLIMRSAS